jgi:thiamine pyrophosphate-dependent acetolactate synthase large subunit-like protein
VRGSTGSSIPAFAGTGFGQAPRYAKDMKVIQLDIAPEEIGHNKPTEVPLVGPRVGP